MRNGGGPACLRLRVVLSESEKMQLRQASGLMSSLLLRLAPGLKSIIVTVLPADLADPKLVEEVKTGLDELTQITGLGSIYSFQQSS